MISVGIYDVASIYSMKWPQEELSQECWCGCGAQGRIVRVCDSFLSTNAVGTRLWQRIDRFSAIALGLSDKLATRAKELAQPEDIGVFVGNEVGGWAYAEPQLANLKTRGWRRVGTFQATAWFPAAAQGEISIRHGLKGYSKTYSTKGISGLEAIYFAALAISFGRVKFAIAGAVEAATNDFAVRGIFGCPTSATEPIRDGGAFVLLGNSHPSVPRLTIGPVVYSQDCLRGQSTEIGGPAHVEDLIKELDELPSSQRYETVARTQTRRVSYILEK